MTIRCIPVRFDQHRAGQLELIAAHRRLPLAATIREIVSAHIDAETDKAMRNALAAATGTAKTVQPAECEASQSGMMYLGQADQELIEAKCALEASTRRVRELEEALEMMPDEIEVYGIMRSGPHNRASMAKAIGARIDEIRRTTLSQEGL